MKHKYSVRKLGIISLFVSVFFGAILIFACAFIAGERWLVRPVASRSIETAFRQFCEQSRSLIEMGDWLTLDIRMRTLNGHSPEKYHLVFLPEEKISPDLLLPEENVNYKALQASFSKDSSCEVPAIGFAHLSEELGDVYGLAQVSSAHSSALLLVSASRSQLTSGIQNLALWGAAVGACTIFFSGLALLLIFHRNLFLPLERISARLRLQPEGLESLSFESGREILEIETVMRSLEVYHEKLKAFHAKQETHAKNAAIARMVQMLAHDIRKPFAIVKGSLECLQFVTSLPELKHKSRVMISDLNSTITQVEGLLEDVMETGRDNPPILEPTSLESLIQMTVKEILRIHRDAKVNMQYHFHHEKQLRIEARKVARVLSNIINNALQAMNMQGALYIESKEIYENNAHFVHIIIGNNGPVIPEHVIPNLFQAFFTSDKKGGTGLGLAIAEKVVKLHGGTIWCESPGQKTQVEFHFTLPLCDIPKIPLSGLLPKTSREFYESLAASLAFDTQQTSHPILQSKAQILSEEKTKSHSLLPKVVLVEDMSSIRMAFKTVMSDAKVISFSHPEALLEALELDSSLAEAAFFVLDNSFGRLSTMSGFELAETLKQKTNSPIILFSNGDFAESDLLGKFDGKIDKEPISFACLSSQCAPV